MLQRKSRRKHARNRRPRRSRAAKSSARAATLVRHEKPKEGTSHASVVIEATDNLMGDIDFLNSLASG